MPNLRPPEEDVLEARAPRNERNDFGERIGHTARSYPFLQLSGETVQRLVDHQRPAQQEPCAASVGPVVVWLLQYRYLAAATRQRLAGLDGTLFGNREPSLGQPLENRVRVRLV